MNTKYFKTFSDNVLLKQLEIKFNFQHDYENTEIIIAYDDLNILGFLEFINNEKCKITNLQVSNDDKKLKQMLLSKLLLVTRLINNEIEVDELLFLENFNDLDLDKYQEGKTIKIKNDPYKYNRLVKIGEIPTGKLNKITDVPGVLVGHSSINDNFIHTGVTAIIPHQRNLFKEKVLAATYAYNGFGKSIGSMQVDELGNIETPILLTNTLSVGKVSDGLIEFMLKDNPDIGVSTGTINPMIFECNDGHLNDIRARILDKTNVFEALSTSTNNFLQGNVGAGSGMRCHGFKGGIGSSSRVISYNGVNYTIGVLVNSNFLGGSPKHLIFNNNHIGPRLKEISDKDKDLGSIIVVIATDLPLDSRQLKRLCKRAAIGIGKTGGYAGNGSGDVFVAFSTANVINHYPTNCINTIYSLDDEYIDNAFIATVQATEEAILNSLLYSNTVVGFNNHKANTINNYIEIFDDLLINNIF